MRHTKALRRKLQYDNSTSRFGLLLLALIIILSAI